MDILGGPKVGDLVVAKISRVAQFGAYCKLIEYNDIDSYLPIREVSSGWIKNIHEFIHNGQTVICRVIFIDKIKGTIDISIKKVNNKQAKDKMDSYNLEKRLTAIYQQALKEVKITTNEEKEATTKIILSVFPSFTEFMKNANNNTEEFSKLKISKKLKDAIINIIESNKKEKVYKVVYTLTMSTYNTKEGILQIREALVKMIKIGVTVEYISAPKYRLLVEANDYLEAEKKLKDATDSISEMFSDGVFVMEKEKQKKEKSDIMDNI